MRWRPRLRPQSSLLRSLRCTTCFGLGCFAFTLVQAGAQAAQTPPPESRVPAAQEEAATFELRNDAGLPDSPGTVMRRRIAGDAPQAADSDSGPATDQATDAAKARASDTVPPKPCATPSDIAGDKPPTASGTAPTAKPGPACPPQQNPYQRFLNSTTPIPLTPRQKGYLAVRNFIDPGNIVTIIGTSGIAIASDSHTAYGPGWRGFGRNAGISFVEDATGNFFGTFLVPSIAHEDPHYHRRPNASIPMRTLHAISRTVVAQGDDGHAMPNYATLLTYPITAEIANLYVPGIASNGPDTAQRVLLGYATDPIDNLITEFLPDVAKRVHVRVIFVQQIINQVASGQPISMF